ncbi:epsin-1 isoform X3 [Wyeomyia smithii]|uniref:epsin-1 isoform X3 n=1 Tax=Wyeomyia smithii TaxID=174621 RepID=UPI002468011D|nr:epsin-1 isoform X3 [Wyeomyia smithii]XP_055530188.1 epsin-1 isoform X3 [Wyeomyia smithii]XP_055530189.1 epsin-1 isoform X3 [Wyeomyia smithii]XP_055530190.1 epsin-1 isoform X3 [Wyeomyia smithii]XP_055530191.1 epsin-1 isoform X3 [Wyeomyia smithii]XP_055530192.1 epsin-1 isoform X3 [Wyeomyia smithii]XP_055530193.1 epsin-1 isoform X3 [Wyeomyia smithii]XP_055530195.1 epsin-1 isoform X3 [Wyeomyia smithii]XP_055530196.1 epsin-1 isoform X3 [Wyeomyia smithii]
MKRNDTQMNVAGIRRNIKNLAHNYSDAQIKVREATSNDPWGPSSTIMAEIADLTYNVVAFSEIMQMIWKRTNDHGKNWRHVYKALLLLEYLIKTGTEKVAQQCKENIYAIQTLKDFQYMEEGKDQGMHVREKAKQLVQLLKDDERLKNERARALKAKERFARTASGFGSDGSIDGPTQKDSRPPNWGEGEPTGKPVSEIEFVRPQTVGEEELQLQLAMAMSREEAEQEEQKRRSDDVRLQLALSQSEQDFKKEHTTKPADSALVDLLDISFGATSISNPVQQPGPSTSSDPWGLPVAGGSRPQTSDPWSRTSSPPVVDPWLNSASALPPPSVKVPVMVGAVGGQLDAWAPVRTQSPSVTSGSSVEGWLNNGAKVSTTAPLATNGNIDPWQNKISLPSAPLTDAWQPKRSTPVPTADPWQPNANPVKHDPWAPVTGSADGAFAFPANRPSPVGAITSPTSDLDEFDIITKRSSTSNAVNNNLNNNGSLLDDLDPLSSSNTSSSASNSASASTTAKKTPASFLGENSALVNLDNLIKPVSTTTTGSSSAPAYNPFGEAVPPQKNLFQQNQPQVPSINQLKQSPFPVTLNQDPWAPVNPAAATQFEEKEINFGVLPVFDTTNRTDVNNNTGDAATDTCDKPLDNEDEILFNTDFFSSNAPAIKRQYDDISLKQTNNQQVCALVTPNNNTELSNLYDFGFSIDDQYDSNNTNTNHNNINNNNAPWMNPQSSNPFLS